MSKLHSRKGHAAASAAFRRPGDHHFVNVEMHSEVGTSGETVSTVGVQLGAAPVPERKYVADICHLEDTDSGVKLIFGQAKLGEEQLRSAVVIKMSRRGVSFLLNSIDEIDSPSYAEIAQRECFEAIKMKPVRAEPEQVVMLAANFAISAMSGEETSIDFLQLSPFAFAALSRGAREAPIDPVVRIDLSSQTFLGLVEGLREIPGVKQMQLRLVEKKEQLRELT